MASSTSTSTSRRDSGLLCQELLEATGVAPAPGIDFNGKHARRFVRFAFCGAPADVADGAERVEIWLRSRC